MNSPGHRRSPHIVIVDDDRSVQRALCRLCRAAEYSVAAYDSAEAFVEAAVTDETDCLILDVHLPGRSGFQLQSDLRSANSRLPVIFVTAFDCDQARTQAIDTGAVAFFRKPLDNGRLLEAIERVLDSCSG